MIDADRIHSETDCMENDKFWRWVCSRPAHDTPRGDFIRDTRDLIDMDISPGSRMHRACEEATREYRALCRQWDNAGHPDAPPMSRYNQRNRATDDRDDRLLAEQVTYERRRVSPMGRRVPDQYSPRSTGGPFSEISQRESWDHEVRKSAYSRARALWHDGATLAMPPRMLRSKITGKAPSWAERPVRLAAAEQAISMMLDDGVLQPTGDDRVVLVQDPNDCRYDRP